MYYLCSENKGTDQLCRYCIADLHLCFSLCMLLVFSYGSSNEELHLNLKQNQCHIGDLSFTVVVCQTLI